MSKNLKVGLLIAFIIVGLAFVYLDKVSLTEFATALGIYLAGIITYEKAIEPKR